MSRWIILTSAAVLLAGLVVLVARQDWQGAVPAAWGFVGAITTVVLAKKQ